MPAKRREPCDRPRDSVASLIRPNEAPATFGYAPQAQSRYLQGRRLSLRRHDLVAVHVNRI